MLGLIFLSMILWFIFGTSGRSWSDEKKRLYKERIERERNRW
jgi:hypothetical protein